VKKDDETDFLILGIILLWIAWQLAPEQVKRPVRILGGWISQSIEAIGGGLAPVGRAVRVLFAVSMGLAIFGGLLWAAFAIHPGLGIALVALGLLLLLFD